MDDLSNSASSFFLSILVALFGSIFVAIGTLWKVKADKSALPELAALKQEMASHAAKIISLERTNAQLLTEMSEVRKQTTRILELMVRQQRAD